MTSRSVEPPHQLLSKAQQGDAGALARLRDELQPALMGILLARGVRRSEAEEILADLWSECVPDAKGIAPLLNKYNGNASPLGWFGRVAINRWIDTQRRRSKFENDAEADLDDLPGCPTVLADGEVHAALRVSLRSAFANCPPEVMLMLRLVYLHDLTQREAGQLFGWTESKTSRALAQATAQIEKDTLNHLRQHHPLLDLTWDDLLALCNTKEIDFL